MSKSHIPGSGRVERDDALLLATPGKQPRFANDSLGQSAGKNGPHPIKRPYVTRSRAATIGASLNSRQKAILSDVARLGVASGGQLQRLHYEPSEAGRRLARIDLAALCELRVLSRLGRTIGGVRAGSRAHCFALGVAGQRIVWPDRRRYREPWTPNRAYLRHALAVSELYTQLRTAMGTRLTTYDTEPSCWRSYFGPGGAPATLKPDAFVVLDLGRFEDRFWIEMDLATESGPRITTKAWAYVRYWQSGREQAASGIFPQVLWITTSETRRALMVAALTRLPAEHWRLFVVVTTDQAADLTTRGAVRSISNREEDRS
jgi:hypothetical protein